MVVWAGAAGTALTTAPLEAIVVAAHFRDVDVPGEATEKMADGKFGGGDLNPFLSRARLTPEKHGRRKAVGPDCVKCLGGSLINTKCHRQ